MSELLKRYIKGTATDPALADDILKILRAPIKADDDGDEKTQQEIFAENLSEAIAQRISVAVQKYLSTAVRVQVTVAPGIAVTTAGTPTAQTGATSAPGTGTGTLLVPDPIAIPSVQ